MTATIAPASRSLWADRRFVTYFSGQTVSEFGDRITELAVPLIAVTTLHAEPVTVGLLTAAVWVPNVFAVFIGAWVDQRPRKRRLLMAADLLRCVTMLSLPIAHYLGVITLTQLFVVAIVASVGQIIYQTAYQNFFVRLVRRDRYVEANSMLSGARSVSFVAGPAVGGLLIQALGAPVAVLVDAASFLVSALTLGRVRIDEETEPARSDGYGLLRRSREGMRFVLRDPYLRASLGCATTGNFFSFVISALVILFASRQLHLSAGVIGLALGIGAIGGLIGALIAGRLGARIGVGRTIAWGSVFICAPCVLVPLAGGSLLIRAGVLGLIEFLVGVGVMCFDINLNALQTAVTPDALRSRVSGAFSTINYGIRPLGAIVGGLSGQFFGIVPTIVAAGLGGALSFLWLLPSPIITTRRIDDLTTSPWPAK